MELTIIFSLFLFLLLIGINIFVSIGLTVILGLFLGDLNLILFTQKLFTTFESFPLLAVPFFILAGEIMQRGTMSEALIDFSKSLVGHLRGALSQISILTSFFYGALCGSAPATTAAVGGMMIPAMEKDGYPKDFSTAVNVSAGCLGVMIPPSVPLILYGSTANISISDLFIATIVPGCIVGIALLVISYLICYKKSYGTKLAKASSKERLKSFWQAKWSLMVPVIVLGGIYGGITTPTEAGVIAVVYALIIEIFVSKNMTWNIFKQIINSTLKTMGSIFIIVLSANALATLLLYYDAQEIVKNFMLSFATSQYMLLSALLVLLLFLGMFMETVSCILVLTPLLLPTFVAVGIDPIHFGVVMIIALSIGFTTPPVGVNLYVGCGISRVMFSRLCLAVIPFVLAMIVALCFITFIPQTTSCLL